MIAAFERVGEEELQLANSIAWDTWRLNKARSIESTTLATADADADLDPASGKTLGLMSLYAQRLDRSISRNRGDLHKIQGERKAKYKKELEEETLIARYCDDVGSAYEAPTKPHANGSVFRLAKFRSRPAKKQDDSGIDPIIS